MRNLTQGFSKQNYHILLVDDRLGNASSSGFFQYKLNKAFSLERGKIQERYGEIDLKFSVVPEESIVNLEYRLKSEPFDLILLDLNFQHNVLCLQQSCNRVPKQGEGERSEGCLICEQVYSQAKKDDDRITPDKVYDELGAYWLKYKIRQFNPAIPVVIFTSKYRDAIEMASKYGLQDGFAADYYEKTRLAVDDPVKEKEAFSDLLFKIIDRIRNYETSYHDRIEVSETREEEYLAAKSRDYMQTLLWNVLTDCTIDRKNNKFAVVFLDFDGMKKVNETFGYTKTNGVIKNFTELLNDEIDRTWKQVVMTRHEAFPFYRPVLGRFFRERGDEFLIFFPSIIGKKTEDNGKKGIIEFLENLRATVNTKKWQEALFKVNGNEGGNTRGLKLTSSMGLFVFPDDLSIECLKRLKKIEKRMREPLDDSVKTEWCSDVSEIYSQITQIPQVLKDNAKLLGKNQFCYFHEAGQMTGSEIRINPRVNVGIFLNVGGLPFEDKIRGRFIGGLVTFLQYLTDKVAFDFEIIQRDVTITIDAMKKMDPYYHIFLLPGWDQIPKAFQGLEKKHGFVIWNSQSNGASADEKQYRQMPALHLFFTEAGKWILNDDNLADHEKMLTSVNYLKEARKCFFSALEDLAESCRNDEYFPRFVIQDAIRSKFEDLKKDVAILSGKEIQTTAGDADKLWGEHTEQLIAFAKGLSIGLPQDVWMQRRVSNKGGDDRYNIIVPIDIEVDTYKFLRLDAGRNLVKLQQYFDGFLKGFLTNSPDKAMADQVVEQQEEMTSPEYNKKKGMGGIVLCRLPFFSPVSPNVYQIITQPARVRLDEYIRGDRTERALDLHMGLESIQHVSLKDALALRLISEDSPVHKFFQTYMTASGDDYSEKFKLVIYAGSEMIGPSVQVAELAGCITEALMGVPAKYVTKEEPFLFLDIFSGSSSTTIPSVFRFKDFTNRYIRIERVDSSIPNPDDDYLKLLFREDANIELRNYKPVDVFDAISKGLPETIFPESAVPYDICIADPPHYMTLDFLSGKRKPTYNNNDGYPTMDNILSKSFGDVLSQKVKVFILYYAHKEQKRLCERVRFELSRYYNVVYRVIVGSEEMAVCYDDYTMTSQIESGLKSFKILYRERYDNKLKLPFYSERSYYRDRSE